MTSTTGARPPLLLLCAAQFMLALDFAIVNVALGGMQHDLGFTDSGLQWVVGAYALFYGGFLLLGGRAGDVVGRKRLFVIGLLVFTLASLLGGIATEPFVLVAARALQGLAAAAVSPAVLALIAAGFPEGKERVKAMGVFGAVSSAGFSGGVAAGGLLTEYISWRAVMLVNLPVGIVLVALAAKRLVADHQATRATKLDVPGAILVTSAMCALSYGLTTASDEGWSATPVIVSLAAGAVLLIAFLIVQTRVAAPLVPLSVFRNRSLSSGNGIAFLSGGVMSVSTFFITLYLQQVLGYSAVKTGLAFFPQAFVVFLASVPVIRLTEKLGARTTLIIGGVLLTAGSALLAQVTAASSYLLVVLPGGVLLGLGVTVMMITTAVAATSGVAGPQMGLASGLYNSSRQLGVGLCLALGVALAGLAHGAVRSIPVGGFQAAFWFTAALSVGIVAAAGLGLRGTAVASAPAAKKAEVPAGGGTPEGAAAAAN
ncbi:MFS transporter [Streptomyces spiroverticillatus]|uniref:MFS transporter n=1 Tax=Streptomyces finlayi TaxID=67296 RepID=A0A918X551_9ACTN|nr:MFS transporter [Streptomyces finlayi]GHA31800.1 MFS transporter [Streptomyces spiroverticillatus]GHD10888.1 MFS transporter [Streptomyces finlayi]